MVDVCSIFDKPVYLIGDQGRCISLFKNEDEFELFQLRMGLQNLCQNTLVYPVDRNANGHMQYKTKVSPHANEFYNNACVQFRAKSENASKCCDDILQKIAVFFCENGSVENLNSLDYTLYPYNPAVSQECYIRYKCPYVHLYKFGFPIYVNGSVIAVLFTGQFYIETPSRPFFAVTESSRMGLFRWNSKPENTSSTEDRRRKHCFSSEDDLMNFVETSLLRVVFEFSRQAQQNLINQQIKLLKEIIEKQAFHMEEDVVSFLLHMDTDIPGEKYEPSIQKLFWGLIAKNLKTYLEQIDTSKLLLFMKGQHEKGSATQRVQGIQLYPELEQCSEFSFDFQVAQDSCSETTVYTVDYQGNSSNTYLFNCLDLQIEILPEQCDILAHLEKLQPFALVISYSPYAQIIETSSLRRDVLEQLKYFFTKVGQELAYLSIRLSEHINKTVLRIYRHEIAHQVTVLSNNNWFLDIQRLRTIDENKLRRVAEDQRQCIYELDFMTQNIDLVTGTINKRIPNLNKEQYIDVSNEIINKAISIYQRAKRDKSLWFSVQNHSAEGVLKSNLELLDMIFFNLMSNAIKYAYPGTKIIIGLDDTDSYAKPHKLSITDFGTAVAADYPSQVFQIYFRGNATKQVEGSGIGLYAAKEISDILDATLSWRCTKISDYNIPMLMRYLNLPLEFQNPQAIDLQKVKAERQRLIDNSQLSRVFNEEYLNCSKWSRREILGELMRPTYEVTFMLEL